MRSAILNRLRNNASATSFFRPESGSWDVVESPRRKHPALSIDPESGRLQLHLPPGFPRQWIPRLLEDNAPLVERLFHRHEKRMARRPQFEFNENGRFLYLGEWYPLRFSRRVSAFDGAFVVPAGTADEVKEALEQLYRRLARELFSRKVMQFALLHDLHPGTVSVNGAVGRWGSCSSSGNLHFSWRLLQCPETAVDYVIIHELAHLRELNHSARFWNVVRSMCPEYEQINRYLTRHAADYRGW